MTFMRVSLVELLCQSVMALILALEYMLLGTHGLLWPCPIVPGAMCRRFLRPQCWQCLYVVESSQVC
jgi:hypothetical protein